MTDRQPSFDNLVEGSARVSPPNQPNRAAKWVGASLGTAAAGLVLAMLVNDMTDPQEQTSRYRVVVTCPEDTKPIATVVDADFVDGVATEAFIKIACGDKAGRTVAAQEVREAKYTSDSATLTNPDGSVASPVKIKYYWDASRYGQIMKGSPSPEISAEGVHITSPHPLTDIEISND